MFFQPIFITLGSIVVILTSTTTTSATTTCSRISAAFNYDLNMYFIIGDDVISVAANNHVIDRMRVYELDFPHEITAAVGLNYYREFFLVSGSDDEGFVGFGQRAGHSIISYTDIERTFDGEENYHGIDAAVRGLGIDVMYFSGCSYVSIDPDDPLQISSLVRNSVLGLPCDLDAAVFHPLVGVPMVIKGDAVWQMNPMTDRFDGPSSLTDFLHGVDDIQFCPFIQ